MYANGFLEERRRSPAGLAVSIGLHGAALVALIAFGTTTFQREVAPRLTMIPISDPHVPPPDPPPPPQRPDQQTPQQIDRPTVAQTDLPIPSNILGPPTPPTEYHPPLPPGPQVALTDAAIPRVPEPVRHAASVDPNYRDALQPPYPANMERLGRNGSVQVRITIGTDGRVTAIQQMSATDDAFWRVTQRQAMNRWRFRPATLDGRSVVSTMVMTVTFRIPDEA